MNKLLLLLLLLLLLILSIFSSFIYFLFFYVRLSYFYFLEFVNEYCFDELIGFFVTLG